MMVERRFLPRRLVGVGLALILALALSLPARADVSVGGGIVVVDSDLPFVSNNIDVLGRVPIVGAIGANFHPRFKRYMYVTGTTGLTTLDIGDPARPRVTDFDPLPHFENEDVTVGGNFLLIANDRSAGVGLLYIFDISQPATPVLRGEPFLIDVAGSGTTGTVTGMQPTPSHTVTCIKGCQFAYLAGTSAGIGILDLRNPDAPKIAGRFVPPITKGTLDATHDVQVDSAGVAWIVGGGGTAAYNITNPLKPVLIGKTNKAGAQTPLNDFIHHNSTRPNVRRADGTVGPGNVVLITEEDYERPTCKDAGSFQTWKINGALSATTPATLTPLDSWITELDELTRTAGHSPATVLCSAHWFDVRNGLVAQGWYEQGTRILDVRDPRNIRQVGYFVAPVTETWDARWAPTDPTGEILYTFDLAGGIDILRFHRSTVDAPAVRAPVRASWIAPTGTVPASDFSSADTTFGWACRIPRVTE